MAEFAQCLKRGWQRKSIVNKFYYSVSDTIHSSTFLFSSATIFSKQTGKPEKKKKDILSLKFSKCFTSNSRAIIQQFFFQIFFSYFFIFYFFSLFYLFALSSSSIIKHWLSFCSICSSGSHLVKFIVWSVFTVIKHKLVLNSEQLKPFLAYIFSQLFPANFLFLAQFHHQTVSISRLSSMLGSVFGF